jgi:hypothetical protein
MPYNFFEQCKRLIQAHHGQIDEEDFGAEVTMFITFVVDDLPGFADDVAELTSGQVSITEL